MPYSFNSIALNSTVAQADNQIEPTIIAIDANVDWDNFLDFSTWLIGLLDAHFIGHELGADLHRTTFDFEDTRLFITLEETSGSLWIELDRKEDADVLVFVASLLKSHQ